MTYLITTNGTRRQLPRPQISDAVDGLAIVHRPRTTFDDGYLEAVTRIQGRIQGSYTPIYKVAETRVSVYCPDMFEHRDGSDRNAWQPVIVPSHLDTHELVVAWLVAGIAGDAVEGIAA